LLLQLELGSVAFGDNRPTQHNPINDYHGFRRIMHRVTLAGGHPADRPESPSPGCG
jgi:taurine dioxygenase